MVDVITGVVICHVNIFCHQKRNQTFIQENAVVCKFLKEVDNKPLPEWCYNTPTVQLPRRRNEF